MTEPIARATPVPFQHSRTRTISQSNLKQGERLRNVFKAGRPPWYNTSGQKSNNALIIGVCGGTASGKTTLANRIIDELDVKWVCLLSMDSFYKVLNEEEHERAARSEYDFDCPDAFDVDLLVHTLTELKAGRSVEVPHYNFKTHGREPGSTMYGADVIVFEGIMAFIDPRLRDLLDIKVFVTEDADVRLARRLLRDTQERGRSVDGSIKQYNKFVYPAFKDHIEPTMQYADLVVPRGASNAVAMDMIVSRVQECLALRGCDLRRMANPPDESPDTLHVLPSTDQIVGMFTTIRDHSTPRETFVFACERLQRLLVEYALTFCEFEDHTVQTCAEDEFHGRRRSQQLSCITIIRSGMSFEGPIRQCIKDTQMGHILIQTNLTSKQPEFFHKVLPADIQSHKVLLFDATVATGAAATMAIRVLKDHRVEEKNIILCTLLASKMGASNLAYAFPEVTIVSGAVDEAIDQQFRIRPGLGNFGDRYYGTDAVDGSQRAETSSPT